MSTAANFGKLADNMAFDRRDSQATSGFAKFSPIGRRLVCRARAHAAYAARAAGGAAVILTCLEAGLGLQQRFGLPIPGSVIGMVLLLALLHSEIVPDSWMRDPCTWLLILLPALFVPLYVVPLSDPGFWRLYGVTLLPAAVLGVVVTLAVTGWLAWRIRRQ